MSPIKCVPLFLIMCSVSSAHFEQPTTKSYDITVPGSNPIRIYEAEQPWGTPSSRSTPESKYERRSTTLQTKTNLNDPGEEDTTEFSPTALQEFLKTYAGTVKSKPFETEEEEAPQRVGNSYFSDDSKNWDLLHVERHKHPYEDKKGWVTLEPVPWSVSKISKWHSTFKPQENLRPFVNNYQQDNDYNRYKPKPYRPHYFEQEEEEQDEEGYYNRPYNRPSYPSRPSVYTEQDIDRYDPYVHRKPAKRPSYHHEEEEDCNHNHNSYHSGIITDGRPSDFPQHHEDYNRRQGTSNERPAVHPFNGDGEWILLSTTKGFKYPKSRERSLKVDADNSIGVHRSVRLTVLPPLKDSNVNMTTSHGGMLQVESTFQTVEQAHRLHQKKQKLKQQKPPTTKRPQKAGRPKPLRGSTSAAAVTTRNIGPDTTSVLAAVGAGLIPATMAMLVPMAMGGRKKRNVASATSNPYPSQLARAM